MKILNLTQHAATQEQIRAGVENVNDRALLGRLLTFDAGDLVSLAQLMISARVEALITEFVLPVQIRQCEELLNAGSDGIPQFGAAAIRTLTSALSVAVMIGGAPFLMAPLERRLVELGHRVCYAVTDRVSRETVGADGAVTKTSVFAHVGLVWAS